MINNYRKQLSTKAISDFLISLRNNCIQEIHLKLVSKENIKYQKFLSRLIGFDQILMKKLFPFVF